MKNHHFSILGTEKSIISLLTALSALIAIRIIYIQHGWINDDSVLYFEVARLFNLGLWKEGVTLYNWSFYPALLAIIYKATNFLSQILGITSASIQNIAQALNVIFFTITTFSFLHLIRIAGGSKTTILCGAMLLFGSRYIVGDILAMLLRDQGFWAFMLTGLFCFTRFYQDGKLKSAILWQISMIVAMLFRLEAITFLLLLPFVLLVKTELSWRQRSLSYLKANLVSALGALILMMFLLAYSTINVRTITSLQLSVLLQYNYTQLIHGLVAKANVMGISVLGSSLSSYALMGIFLTLVGIILVKIASAAGWITITLIACRKKLTLRTPNENAKRIYIWAGILALLNIIVITFSSFVLSGRYIIALAFILQILGAFLLSSLFSNDNSARARRHNSVGIVILTLLSAFIVKSLMSKSSEYNYEQHAVSFVQSQLSKESTVFYVSPRVRYYAGVPYAGRGYNYWAYINSAITDGSIQRYDFLLINMDNKHPERQKILLDALKQYKLLKEFSAYKDKKKMMVFARMPADKRP